MLTMGLDSRPLVFGWSLGCFSGLLASFSISGVGLVYHWCITSVIRDL